MPVNTITYQPAAAQLMAAYRPIVFNVEATDTNGGPLPPFVVCDVYIEDVYYKSILRTSADSQTDLKSVWVFDIQDALQEYMQANIAALENNSLLSAPNMSVKAYAKFRSSVIDANGFTVEEPAVPKQGTKLTAPVPGDGLQSNIFFAINSALQHEDNQNLSVHLNSFKQGTWSNDAYPLTHRKNYYLCPGDSDHFPLAFIGDCKTVDIVLKYRNKGSADFLSATATDNNTCDGIDFTTAIDGNKVTVSLSASWPTGETMLVRYKKTADSTWITAGTMINAASTFAFNVNGTGLAGDYDIQLIRFCTACLSADPKSGTFTLDGSSINLGWRGITPFCVQQVLGSTIYVKLDLRNSDLTSTFFPNDTVKNSKEDITKADLYAMFFSDATLLTPVSVTHTALRIFVVQNDSRSGSLSLDTMRIFTQDVAGTEVLLANVTTIDDVITYSVYPMATNETTTVSAYTPFPTSLLIGGNTGFKGYTTLQQYNTDTGVPTGTTKPNDDSDPDYIAPVADNVTCFDGPSFLILNYATMLEVAKVEIDASLILPVYAPTVADTGTGFWSFIESVPKNTNINISVKAKTLDPGNTTGKVKVSVTYANSLGVSTVVSFLITNNVETALPQTFQNIQFVAISNY